MIPSVLESCSINVQQRTPRDGAEQSVALAATPHNHSTEAKQPILRIQQVIEITNSAEYTAKPNMRTTQSSKDVPRVPRPLSGVPRSDGLQ